MVVCALSRVARVHGNAPVRLVTLATTVPLTSTSVCHRHAPTALCVSTSWAILRVSVPRDTPAFFARRISTNVCLSRAAIAVHAPTLWDRFRAHVPRAMVDPRAPWISTTVCRRPVRMAPLVSTTPGRTLVCVPRDLAAGHVPLRSPTVTRTHASTVARALACSPRATCAPVRQAT